MSDERYGTEVIYTGNSGNFCLLFALRSTRRLHSFHSMFHQLHLSSSAASAPVECMFSSAGLVANGRIYREKNFIVFVLCMTITNYYSQ